MEWLPQQDLLANSKTVLFITHAGVNSQFKALYHGVPMLSIPLCADEHYNAKRAEFKGFSITLDIKKITIDNVISSITEILRNSSYKEQISQASRIFRSSAQSPKQRAAWWIEHVMQHGAKHLRAPYLEMPWYQLLMIDIIIFVILCFIIMTLIASKITLYLTATMRCLQRNQRNKKQIFLGGHGKKDQ